MRNWMDRSRLVNADRNIKLLYALFLVTLFIGFGFTFFWAHDMTGLTYAGIVKHYLGSEETFGEPKGFRELAETFHFHLFTMPVIFLILCHVLYLTSLGNVWKQVTTCLAFAGLFLDLFSPWLIRYVAPVFALTMLLGDLLMVTSFLVMMVVPLYEIWGKRPPSLEVRGRIREEVKRGVTS